MLGLLIVSISFARSFEADVARTVIAGSLYSFFGVVSFINFEMCKVETAKSTFS